MKITDYKAEGGDVQRPCELVTQYLMSEQRGVSFRQWIAGFDFDTAAEIELAVKKFAYTLTGDTYMAQSRLSKDDPFSFIIYRRFLKLATDISRFDKYAAALAREIWNGGYRQKQLKARFETLVNKHVAIDTFAAVCEKIKGIYALTDEDIKKIAFFVEQVKSGCKFPNSLRRMLYIWGDAKMTGKTTVANTLVAILNGEPDIENAHEYATTLTTEMQIRSFAVPRISVARCCVMDECFYADMGKTYADFKRYLTSSNGRARLPYGQEFEWHGQPNYIATSNDPLRKFIKDWNDRRYLSVQFKQKPAKDMTFAEIYDLWLDFVCLSKEPDNWKELADSLFDAAEEVGERTEVAEEFVVELQQSMFADFLRARRSGQANDRITLKVFVDYFAQSIGNVEAHKRKSEIERAVEQVFGKRYSTTNYWLLPRLIETLNNLQQSETAQIDDENDDIDF